MADYSALTAAKIKADAADGFDWEAYWRLGDRERANLSERDMEQEQLLKEKLQEAGYNV